MWADAMRYEKNRRIIKRTQRTTLCITTTAYRTVFHAALCVLTGNLPIYIKVKMLKESYERTKIYMSMAVEGEVIDRYIMLKEELDVISKKALQEWQAEWSKYSKETRKLVGNAVIFAKKWRDVDHFTMQMITEHGIDTRCWDSDDPNDDAEHVLFESPKWTNKRIELENFLGVRISVDNLVDTVVTKDEYWTKLKAFCKSMINYRREMEKAMGSANRSSGTSTQR